MNAIVLIGLSGTGKTSVARRLAEHLRLPFVDTDDMVAARAGKPVHRVFAEEGEEHFRPLESAAIEQVAGLGPCVVATGGGAVLCPHNRALLTNGNLVIWLAAPPPVLAARLQGHAATPDERPLLRGDDLERRLEDMVCARDPLYRACATLRIETAGQTVEEVAGRVLDEVERWRSGGHDG